MRTDAMAEALIVQARARLEHARVALREGNFPFAIRLSQECVEMSLKAISDWWVWSTRESMM